MADLLYPTVYKRYKGTLVVFLLLTLSMITTVSAQESLTPTRVSEFDKGQCTWYVAGKREDVFYWLPDSGADAKTWSNAARENGAHYGIEVDNIPDVGDIAVFDPQIEDADASAGHVAYVESVNLNEETFRVSEYNATVVEDYGERTIDIQDGITFIGMPTNPILLAEIGLAPEQATAYPYVVSRPITIINPIQNITVVSDVPFVLSIDDKIVLERTSISGYQRFKKQVLLIPGVHIFQLEYQATIYQRGASFDNIGWPVKTVYGAEDEWFFSQERKEPSQPSISFGDLLEIDQVSSNEPTDIPQTSDANDVQETEIEDLFPNRTVVTAMPPTPFLLEPTPSAAANIGFGSSAIWNPSQAAQSRIYECYDSLELTPLDECLFTVMEEEGASPEAIELAKLLKPSGGGFMSSFEERGLVDSAYVFYPFRANNNVQIILINGAPEVVPIEDVGFDIETHPTYPVIAQRYPDAFLWPGEGKIVNDQQIQDDAQSIVISYPLVDGCHACGYIGQAEIAFNFDSQGNFLGTKLLTLSLN